MAVTLNRNAGLEPPETTALTTTDATVVHTASAHVVRTVEAIVLRNVDNTNACRVLLAWNDGSTDLTFWNGNIQPGATEIVDIPMVTSGIGKVRSIKATAEAADDINVTVFTSSQTRQAAT